MNHFIRELPLLGLAILLAIAFSAGWVVGVAALTSRPVRRRFVVVDGGRLVRNWRRGGGGRG